MFKWIAYREGVRNCQLEEYSYSRNFTVNTSVRTPMERVFVKDLFV